MQLVFFANEGTFKVPLLGDDNWAGCPCPHVPGLNCASAGCNQCARRTNKLRRRREADL